MVLRRKLHIFLHPRPSLLRCEDHDSIWTCLWLRSVTLYVFFYSLPQGKFPSLRAVAFACSPVIDHSYVSECRRSVSTRVSLGDVMKPGMVATGVRAVHSVCFDRFTSVMIIYITDLHPFLTRSVFLVLRSSPLHHLRQIHTTSSTLILVTHILILNLFILALSPSVRLLEGWTTSMI